MLKLLYPITTELFTFVNVFNRAIGRALREECDASIVQYRTLSLLKQPEVLREGRILQILETTPSRFSQELGALVKRGFVLTSSDHGPAKTISLTKAGLRALRDADLVLVDACNRVFEPLGTDLGGAIRAGSMLTNQRHGVVRIEEGAFFEEHACFEAFLAAERISKKATHDYGLSLTEFRILFEMLSNGPARKSHFAKRLQLSPSVISTACDKLAERSLVTETRTMHDRRIRTIALTEQGRELTECTAIHVDRRCFEDIRPSSDEERDLYQRMADIIA